MSTPHIQDITCILLFCLVPLHIQSTLVYPQHLPYTHCLQGVLLPCQECTLIQTTQRLSSRFKKKKKNKKPQIRNRDLTNKLEIQQIKKKRKRKNFLQKQRFISVKFLVSQFSVFYFSSLGAYFLTGIKLCELKSYFSCLQCYGHRNKEPSKALSTGTPGLAMLLLRPSPQCCFCGKATRTRKGRPHGKRKLKKNFFQKSSEEVSW